jgi:hypothetical protein
MDELSPKYRSYLLRLWQNSPQAMWRASVHCVQTNEIAHFADLDGLFAFLWKQTVMTLTVEQTAPSPGEQSDS